MGDLGSSRSVTYIHSFLGYAVTLKLRFTDFLMRKTKTYTTLGTIIDRIISLISWNVFIFIFIKINLKRAKGSYKRFHIKVP